MARKKNILVLTYWSYKDALIQAYTLPYLNIIADLLPFGSRIYLVTIEQKHLKMDLDERVQVKARLRQLGIRLITVPYRRLNPVSLFRWLILGIYLVLFTFAHRIRYIHAWCTTAGSFGYLLAVFTGRKLIIDSYEPHAEAMVENKTWEKDSAEFRMLFFLEKKLSRRANVIISATQEMKNYAKEKYDVQLDHFYVKPACVDLEAFTLSHRKNPELVRQFGFDDKIVCVYAGKFGGIYMIKEVFDFFKACEDYWGDKFRVLLLTSHNKKEIGEWCQNSGVDESKLVIRFVPHADIADYMGLGDFAVTPVKPVPTKRYCTPIKDGEYWALGLPVVIPRSISDDSDLIEDHKIGVVLDQFDKFHYENAIRSIDELIHRPVPTDLLKQIRNVAYQYRNFDIARKVYSKIYRENLP